MGNQVKPVRCLLAGIGHGWLHCIGHVLSPNAPCRTSREAWIWDPKIIFKVALGRNLGTQYLTFFYLFIKPPRSTYFIPSSTGCAAPTHVSKAYSFSSSLYPKWLLWFAEVLCKLFISCLSSQHWHISPFQSGFNYYFSRWGCPFSVAVFYREVIVRNTLCTFLLFFFLNIIIQGLDFNLSSFFFKKKICSRIFYIYEEELCNMLDQEARLAIFTPCYPLVPFNLAGQGDIRKLKNSFL